MFSSLKTIAAELKRANDLKEKDIKNKEMYGWYIRPNPSLAGGNIAASSGMTYTGGTTDVSGITYTTTGDPYK